MSRWGSAQAPCFPPPPPPQQVAIDLARNSNRLARWLFLDYFGTKADWPYSTVECD